MSCSFCRSTQHTIRTCDSENIQILYQRISDMYNNMINKSIPGVSDLYDINYTVMFTSIIRDNFQLNELKAVCIHKFHSSSTMSKNGYVTCVVNEFIAEEDPHKPMSREQITRLFNHNY